MRCLMMQQHWNWTNAIYLMLFIIHTMDQSIMRHGQMPTKKRGSIYMAHRKQNLTRRQPMNLCWRRQKEEMPMPCTIWQRFIHREFSWNQTKKRQKNGITGHSLPCLQLTKKRRMPVCNTISERCISMVLGQEKI